MKKTITIDVPEGFDVNYNSSTKEIEFVKIGEKPKSWEDYCNRYFKNRKNITPANSIDYCVNSENDVKAVFAFIKLINLRKAWIKDWTPSYSGDKAKWTIVYNKGEITTACFYIQSHSMSFPSQDMAVEFCETFKDLLEDAKELI